MNPNDGGFAEARRHQEENDTPRNEGHLRMALYAVLFGAAIAILSYGVSTALNIDMSLKSIVMVGASAAGLAFLAQESRGLF